MHPRLHHKSSTFLMQTHRLSRRRTNMPSYSLTRQTNASFNPSFVPVMVITGSTSGIGKSMVEILSRHLNGRIHIVLVGRNRSVAESTIASLPRSEESTYEFMYCNVMLMKNVHALAKDLSSKLPKINYLVHCAGVFGLGGRDETEEGIDSRLAARYYSRFALTNDLLPLLCKASNMGEPASVLSVQGAGMGPEIDLEDLGLKKNYTGYKAMMQSLCYNDLMVAEFGERKPDIAFTHIHPGNVDTGMLVFSNPIMKGVIFLLRPLIWLLVTTSDQCAEHMLFALLDAKKGMYRRNQYGDDIGLKAFPKRQGAQKALWEHSLSETTV